MFIKFFRVFLCVYKTVRKYVWIIWEFFVQLVFPRRKNPLQKYQHRIAWRWNWFASRTINLIYTSSFECKSVVILIIPSCLCKFDRNAKNFQCLNLSYFFEQAYTMDFECENMLLKDSSYQSLILISFPFSSHYYGKSDSCHDHTHRETIRPLKSTIFT